MVCDRGTGLDKHPWRRNPLYPRIVRPWICGTVAIAFSIAGCDISSMQFVRDERVEIVEPEDRSTVAFPVTLRWQVTDFTVTGRDGGKKPDAGSFAVFVDRPPIPPGTTLEWYVQQDDSCGASACGSVEKLTDVYTTEQTSLKLTELSKLNERGGQERHEVVVVLMDGTGARIGESAFYVTFQVDRENDR